MTCNSMNNRVKLGKIADMKKYKSVLSSLKRYVLRSLKYFLIGVLVLFFGSMVISAVLGVIFERDYDYDILAEFYPIDYEFERYTSGDSLTDLVLNYYSGIEDLPKDLKLERYKKLYLTDLDIKKWGSKERVDSIKSIENKVRSFSSEEFDKYLMKKGINIEDVFRGFPDTVTSESYYHFIWKCYFACGAPKVRVDIDLHFPFSATNATAYYEPFTNSLHLDLYSLLSYGFDQSIKQEYFYWDPSDLIEELSHAKQFKEKPMTSYSKATFGLFRSFAMSAGSYLNMFEENISWPEAYDMEAKLEGSFEHEAHVVMYKELSLYGESMTEGFGK